MCRFSFKLQFLSYARGIIDWLVIWIYVSVLCCLRRMVITAARRAEPNRISVFANVELLPRTLPEETVSSKSCCLTAELVIYRRVHR